MTLLFQACEWLHELPLSTHIRESDNLFSLIETVHVLGTIGVLGIIGIADLRLLGIVLRDTPAASVVRPLIRVTWWGFTVMAISGALLFASQARSLYSNAAFRLKIGLLLLVAANLLVFHTTTFKRVADWNLAPTPPASARWAGFLSLLLWSGVVASGRAIAYLYTH